MGVWFLRLCLWGEDVFAVNHSPSGDYVLSNFDKVVVYIGSTSINPIRPD